VKSRECKDVGVRSRRAQHCKNVFTPSSADSKDRQSTSDYYSITRSLGRQPKTGNSSSHMARTELIQHPAFRHLIPPSHGLQTKTSSINNNYSRIYSGVNRGVYDEATNVDEIPELYRGDAVSSDSDYDTIYSNKEDNGTLLPIGSVFPSGCHRHPARLMPLVPHPQPPHLRLQPCPPQDSHPGTEAQLLSYKLNLDTCHSESSTLHTPEMKYRYSQQYPSFSENSSETDSVQRKERPRLLPDFITKSEISAKTKSFEGLAAFLNKTSFKELSNKSKLSFNEPIVPRRQKFHISQTASAGKPGPVVSGQNSGFLLSKSDKATNKLSGLVATSVSRPAQIIRRHTLHDKSNQRQSQQPVHVHSWHRQDDEQQRSKSSSLKRSVSRRSSSSSRLSLLSRKDDIEISITDSQSLDRLSLASQDDIDVINLEKYLQSAGRAAGWSKEFDVLLSDKIGLGKFTEFLQKEFSHENIFFWSACEKYRHLEQGADRLRLAREIITRHLELGAVEPVNVDSVARAATRHKVALATVTTPPETSVFLPAQRQIYNLMKFDSYPRFLKSEVYKDCIRAEMSAAAGSERNINNNCVRGEDAPRLRNTDSLKTKRRKSMSFWEHWHKTRDTDTGDISPGTDDGARSAAGAQCTLTRVIFPDLATSVVSSNTGESIRAMISRLLDKRNMKLTSFDVFSSRSDSKPLDLSEDCAILHCTEVRVEARILFRLELPSHKSIGVKAKQTKTVREVLAPILQQYGWNINEVDVYVDEDTTIAGLDNGDDKVDLASNVAVIDNKRLFVVQKSSEALQYEVENNTPVNTENTHNSADKTVTARDSDNTEMTLYEGLQIMRKGRFEDQRGTEICFEIPEFLRLPENSAGYK